MNVDILRRRELMAMGNRNLEFIKQFTASAGARTNIIDDIEKYKELVFEVYRTQASSANYSTGIKINGTTYLDNNGAGYAYSPNVWRSVFHYEYKGALSKVTVNLSAVANYTFLAQALVLFYAGTPNGYLYLEAGAAVFDGTEIVTVYGALK